MQKTRTTDGHLNDDTDTDTVLENGITTDKKGSKKFTDIFGSYL